MRTRRLLWVFHWLVVGGEETEVRLLSRHLRPAWEIDVVVCLRRPGMPEQTHAQLAECGVPVDTTPCDLPDDEVVDHLARVIPGHDVVVASQGVPFVHPALARLEDRPPLVEHGGLVREAESGSKDGTDRYVGVCASIRDAAAARMPDRPHHALEIPSMVDLGEFDPGRRAAVRREWGLADDVPVLGWIGRLDRKKRVEDVLAAAALLAEEHPEVRWVLVGGPNFMYPEHADTLRDLATRLGLDGRVRWLGDRADVPRLLTGLDALVWLSEGEGMPHVLAEAGAACLPVVATPDNGAGQHLVHGRNVLFVPHRDPVAVAEALGRVVRSPALRRRLGRQLRADVEARFSVPAVLPRWRALLDELAPA
ncbi:glycosyltransferase family 4 protein [Geodermatophilus sp. CPCC 205506]|uniref:glycosyltransferase family 4 protein n=1 Tax=Geodermatophilus sp. CPCC 205506 TaxID=2936596 RepID=UPI003EEE2876